MKNKLNVKNLLKRSKYTDSSEVRIIITAALFLNKSYLFTFFPFPFCWFFWLCSGCFFCYFLTTRLLLLSSFLGFLFYYFFLLHFRIITCCILFTILVWTELNETKILGTKNLSKFLMVTIQKPVEIFQKILQHKIKDKNNPIKTFKFEKFYTLKKTYSSKHIESCPSLVFLKRYWGIIITFFFAFRQ